jgi:glyoxylase-like metal-dependent hydrolase (beta-lactamase superfamily II)
VRRDVVEVARGVYVATSRRYATTSTFVVSGSSALVVDPAWDADELAGVGDTLTALGVRCAAGLSTHVHYDHVLWHPDLPDVPRWASAWSAKQWRDHRDVLLQPLVGDLSPELIERAGHLTPLPGKSLPEPAGTVPAAREPIRLPGEPGPAPIPLPWSGREIRLYEHDAHAPAHLAAEIPDAGVLLAGDMLSDVELPMPADDDADLTTYRMGLDRIADVVARCVVVVPGHGTPSTDPMSRLDADRRYLDDLDRYGASDDPRQGLPGMAELHAANIRRARS